MTILEKNGQKAALIDRDVKIATPQDALDLIASAWYNSSCVGIIVFKESFSEAFFDLKTKLAGEILQKCSNYHMKLAIVGDFSEYTSKSLKDFIYECNRGSIVFFKNNIESALAVLTA